MSSFKGSNLLITGANGFVGTAAVNHFLNRGAHVVALVKDINRKTLLPSASSNFSIARGDILDRDSVRTILNHYEIDYVLHLAAESIVKICDSDPYSAYTTNVVGTLNVLEEARTSKRRPKKIIVMTSDKAYGPAEVPYKEDTPPVVGDSYATSKTCQDFLSRSYAKTYGLPVVVARASNIYGPGDLNISRLIPRSILNLFNGERPMLYNGVAEFVREFLYIDDVLSGYEVMFEKGVDGEPYNIGGTGHFRIKEVIQMIVDKVAPTASIDIVEKSFYEIPVQYIDGSKLMALGWEPQTKLSEGLDRTIEWYRNYRNG